MDASFNRNDDSAQEKLLHWIIDSAINGFGVFPSAEQTARDHRSKAKNVEEAIDSLIFWSTTQAGATGFVTGLGGIALLPVSIPASLLSCYALGASTAAAIAYLRGYDINSQQVRTMVLLCLLGESAKSVLRTAGVQIGNQAFKSVISQIPGKVLIEINKKIGFRLITKAGEKGVINLMKLVPIAGGVVGAGFDGWFVNTCGQTAKDIFKP